MKDSDNTSCLGVGVLSTKITSRKKVFQVIRLSSPCDTSETGQPATQACLQLQAQLKNASCVEDQMEVIKEISSHLQQTQCDDSGSMDLNYMGIAVDLFLSSPSKHPVKCALSKIFNTTKGNAKAACVTLLRQGLLDRIRTAMSNQDLAVINMATSALLGCFENFLLGPEVVDSIFMNVLQFYEKNLILCYSYLSSQATPTFKVEVNKSIHSITRIIITALQRIESLDYFLETSPNGKACLYNILEIAGHLMRSLYVTLDTRTNFGLVLVLILDLLEGSHGWMQLLDAKALLQEDEDLSCLCICAGLLAGLKQNQFELVHESREETIISCILNVALSVNERCVQESNLVLALWRVVQQFTRVLALNPKFVSCLKGDQMECLMKHLWGLLDHYMDTVRHLAKSILENITQLKDFFLDIGIDVVDKMCEAILLTPETKRSRYVILSTLTLHLNTSEILKRIPNVINNLLSAMQCPSMLSHVSVAFVTMSESDFKKLPYSEWFAIWIVPLFDRMEMEVSSESPALEDTLSKLIKLCPKIINETLSGINNDKGFDLPKLKILLTCMKIGRKLGILLPDYNEDGGMWFRVLPDRILHSALCHERDEIRLLALALIVETSRSTELLSQKDLMLIRLYLTFNISCEVPSIRQQTLAYVYKLLNRVKDSTHSLIRSINQKRKEDPAKILEAYKSFLLWMLTFCFNNLKVGSNYSRRFCSLKFLSLILEILSNDQLVKTDEWQLPVWTNQNALLLLAVILTDSFEENKAIATKILLSYPCDTLGLNNNQKLFKLFQSGCSLASSNHPSDCISSAYLLELCCGFYSKSSQQAALNFNGEGEALDILNAIKCVKVQLENEMNVAKQDILLAASKGPMYGSLFCIRHLMQLITDFSKLERSWQSLVKNLVDLCFKLIKVVLPVVNSSSPEGHLPMDFNQGSSLLDPGSFSVSSPRKVTAQMVLLCSWRTVKEVSLFLGKLSNSCPILPEANGLLGEDEVVAIGVHLTSLLEETKHRGAFEQAYVGFSLLAARLWRHPKKSLQELPQKWLHELMDAIQTNEPTESKLCATRRSAGLPFLVQALVSGELQAGAGHQSLQMTMTQLLACATDSEKHVECRTHSLNILRALFRHAPLAEHVAPYISKGVVVALSGFRGKNWAERNSATLLFSSLMTRIFGVRRSRDELSSRNKMTGRVFFHRYPELYEFLLLELEQAVSALDMGDVSKLSIVHPILLLIARLYPSSLEGTDSPMQLSTFIPLVRHCAGNSVFKTRVLAAKAVVPLITANIFITYIDDLINQMVQNCPENLTHGLVLQVVSLLRSSSTLNEDQEPKLIDMLQTWMAKLLNHLKKLFCKPVCEVICQIFELFIQKWYNFFPSTTWDPLKETMSCILLTPSVCLKSQQSLGQNIFEIRATRVLLQILILQHENQSEALLVELLRHKSYEVVQEVLIVFERLLCQDVFGIAEEIEDILPDVIENDKHWLERLPTTAVSTFRLILCESNCLGQSLASLVAVNTDIRGKLALRVLAHIPPSSWCCGVDPQQLVEWCSSPHEGTSCSALACFSSLLKHVLEIKNKSIEIFEEGCRLLKLFCADDRSVRSRMAAVSFLLKHREALDQKYTFLSDETVCGLWINAIKLTCDDDSQVRSRAALLSQTDPLLVPLKTVEVLLDNFVAVMKNSPHQCLATLLALSLDVLPDSTSFDADEERVFEKGETNLFAESEVLTDLVCKYISPLILTGITLPSSKWNWIWIEIGGKDLCISSAEDLFNAIQQYNAFALNLVDSDTLLPLSIVCSLRRLYKVEKTFCGFTRIRESDCLPFDASKLFGAPIEF